MTITGMVDHDAWLKERLKADPEFAREFIKAAVEDSQSEQELLDAFMAVADAYGIPGLPATFERYRPAGPTRQSLSVFARVLRALGLELMPAQPARDHHVHC